MRLIDADALNDAMYHEAFETDSNDQKWDSGCWIRYKMFERNIRAAQTVTSGLSWASVKEKLPEIGAKCLVYADGKMTVAKHIAHNDWITGVFFPVPTHWMLLPEPPKEE